MNKSLFLIIVLILFVSPFGLGQSAEAEIDSMMNRWHRAAAAADYDAFFGAIDDDGEYLGTEAYERWSKNEFMVWAKPFFDRGKAWDFKALKRNIRINKSGDFAWFDEYLDTWMGTCTASGVLVRKDTGWFIKHYHLSVTVPNSLINDFITLIKAGK